MWAITNFEVILTVLKQHDPYGLHTCPLTANNMSDKLHVTKWMRTERCNFYLEDS